MRRNNTVRIAIIVVAIGWAVYQLFPTFMASRLKDQAATHRDKIIQLTRLQPDDLNEALARGLLEQKIRAALANKNPDSLKLALEEAKELVALDDGIAKYDAKAIQRGLDLQGGSYLVYEVDLPRLLRNVAKNKDQRFEEIMRAVEAEASQPNIDYFEVLQQHFAAADLRLSRYFGSRSQTDAQIIEDLKKGANDSVDRNLEILRNRIDQFGVSEPSITKQGDRRVVVELAGITDVGRAKDIIGRTALLEFKLVRDPEITNEVFTKINEVLRRDLAAARGDSTHVDSLLAQSDSTATTDTTATAKVRSEDEVSVDELFPSSSIVGKTDSSEGDSTLLVDQAVFDENPFYSLLGALGNDFAVPSKNLRAVERILNDPDVKKVIPSDAVFSWSNKPERVADTEYYRLYLLKAGAELTGAALTNASADISSGGGMGPQGEWVVNMEMNSQGAKTFSIVTGANVDKRLSILLDGKVVTAPNINERIPSGRAVIQGGGMDANEAKDLAIVLRAGSLKAPMHVIEERTVGPSLGRDSISKGQYSALLGFAMVVVFMIIYYKVSGVIANVALMLNVVLVMAALALFKATLTLPGIAGIILTIGMAVDANVLIFERIREELRSGKTVRAAIDAGYARAFWTIFDANTTTLLTALVLYQFGTGPIRGFAVTLSIGIVASMFTAIVVTRVIFDAITSRRQVATLSI